MNGRQCTEEAEQATQIILSWRDICRFTALVLAGWSMLLVSVQVANASGSIESGASLNASISEVGMDEVKSGSLLFESDSRARYWQAQTVETVVAIEVTGMIARTRLRQEFKNDRDSWVEGIYVFPLPENAAVDHMRMEIGERRIEGVIKEREDAKQLYMKARRDGKKASLIEQERPNLFTNAVANIGPGEMVTVEIEYQQTLRYDNGAFSLRFPMAITPRYIPGDPLVVEEEITQFDGTGWALDTNQVPDASRITPPVLTEHQKGYPVSVNVTINSGFKLATIESRYHAISTEENEWNRTVVTLVDEALYADRDFELVWRLEQGVAPRAALFTEARDGDLYHLLMVLPPAESSQRRIDREVIYVIDRSGSMSGSSIKQAKHALKLALGRLRPNDRFNVIAFSSNTDRLFSTARKASHQNRRAAQRYVSSLTADGGTEIRAALEVALKDQRESSAVRQVVFLTDGSVGNEAALFKYIKQHLGDSRLFTIGIGSAPNSHFMSRAAQFGRGTFTYIGDVNEVQSKMDGLFQKLETSVMTDLKVTFDDPTVEMWPQRLPDLYQGEPLMLTARSKMADQRVVVTGQRQNHMWFNRLYLKDSRNGAGIATMWARGKIAALMDRLSEGEKEQQVKPAVIDLALRHHLVSKYTSLVAIDVTPSRPDSEPLNSESMPLNLPKGQVHAKISGRHAQTATDAQLQLVIGMMLLLAALWLWHNNKSACARDEV